MYSPFDPFSTALDPFEEHQRYENKRLRKDLSYIGSLSVVLTLVMSFSFPLILLLFVRFGILIAVDPSDPFLGIGNSAYMGLYAFVYCLSLFVPAVLVSLCYKKRFLPFAPSEAVPFGAAFLLILSGVGFCMLANILNSYVLAFFSEMGLSVPDAPQTMVNTPISFWLNLLALAVLPALLEEMIYRGYILRTLRPYGNWYAIIVSSLLFGLMHGNLRQIPFATFVGVVLGILYVMTNNIWISIAVHFANNAVSVIAEYFSFSLSEHLSGVFYAVVIYGLVVVGFFALITVLVIYRKRMRIPKVNTVLPIGKRVKALVTTPLFILSVLLYILLLIMEI